IAAATDAAPPTVVAFPTMFPTATSAPTRLPTAIPTEAPPSHLPATQPGLTTDEGTFLITAADDGSRAAYFIAGDARHSILAVDMQFELARNPLWPVRTVSRDEALAIPESAPIGSAHLGLVTAPVAEPEQVAEQPVAAEP